LLGILEREGVKPIEVLGQPFDPRMHEAIDTVPHRLAGVGPDTIVKVAGDGYVLNGRLLRPARVIVAT
jgi:molecular chaperone GrpE